MLLSMSKVTSQRAATEPLTTPYMLQHIPELCGNGKHFCNTQTVSGTPGKQLPLTFLTPPPQFCGVLVLLFSHNNLKKFIKGGKHCSSSRGVWTVF